MVYAIPPVVRITAHGIRHVQKTVIESATSMGSTKTQLLRQVQLPLARQTIIVGVNQCVMAALSMVTIASLIDAPGLGKKILLALQTLNVGKGFVAGLAIVFLAIMLDRSASAASSKARTFVPRSHEQTKRRSLGIVVAGVITLIMIYLSRTVIFLAVFPKNLQVGIHIENATNTALQWAKNNLYFLTDGLQNGITVGVINPLEWILSGTPWFLTVAMITTLAFIIGGIRPAITAALSFGGIVVIGLWQDSMLTLTQVLGATILTLLLGIALGVGVGRSLKFDRLMRPILDAGQTLPAFVYMVPLLGLFGATRFTAIMAAVVYAFPVVVKLVAEGIRTVPVTIIEAATASGSTSWQMITKVQLPAARKSLTLATNQGLIFVLAMVVVGGLVGGGGLGYDVVNGFVQLAIVGKGLAAGLAIVFMGIGLDRMSQFGAKRGTPADRI
jgi:glycine betaine/proline transport system permease protein